MLPASNSLVPGPNEPTLDCQDCGDVLKILSPAEAQQVARNPYNFIAFCKRCIPGEMQRIKDEALHGYTAASGQ